MVLRIERWAYERFLHPKIASQWNEKDEIFNLPEEMRLETATKKQRDELCSKLTIVKFEKGEIILRGGDLPDNVLIMIEGTYSVHGKATGDETEEEKDRAVSQDNRVFAVRLDPGSKTAKLLQQGTVYGQKLVTTEVTDITNSSNTIGEECDLLGIHSPFTYVAESTIIAYSLPLAHLFKLMIPYNPKGLVQLREKAAHKMNHYSALCHDKVEWDKTVNQKLEYIEAERRHNDSMLTKVHQQAPKAD